MHKEAREELRLRFKLLVLELATHFGPTKTCRDFEVPSSIFYEWKKAFKRDGVAGLKRKKPIALSHPRKVLPDVVDKFPFRIHTIRTDRGHEFQALFHWYVEDQGMQHVYIKPRSPQLNGKV